MSVFTGGISLPRENFGLRNRKVEEREGVCSSEGQGEAGRTGDCALGSGWAAAGPRAQGREARSQIALFKNHASALTG